MKFSVIVADPPYMFLDKLKQSSVKRGSESQYKVLDTESLENLNIKSITEDDAVLVLWVPSSLLQDGLDIMSSWGFNQKQTFVWVKSKKSPFELLLKDLKEGVRALEGEHSSKLSVAKKIVDSFKSNIINFDLNSVLSFYMGRIFRQTHEIALVGKKGRGCTLYNKSQRSVLFDINKKHSAKPEGLQDRLDLMYGNVVDKLELFARRERPGWKCVGLECPSSYGEDIRDSIERLIKL